MVEETTRQALPTATGFAAKQASAFRRQRNVALAPLLRRAGVSETDLEKRPLRISAIAQGKLLEYAAEALDDSAFGLHLAQQSNPREAGLLFYVASAAKTVAEALTLYARYCRIVNEAVRPKLTRSPEGLRAQLHFVGFPRHLTRHNIEFMAVASIKGLREMAGRDFRLPQVSFVHARNSDLREFERFFGCPVEFGALADQLDWSNETLALPLVTEDRYLLDALQPICDEAAKARNTPKGTLRASVENEVQKLLPHGSAERRTVAKALGMSTRTLSRRLAEEDTTFEDVVDRLRQSLALQYIKERELSLSQIAWLIGYEGSTSLNHAFRRWTGRSPSAMRSEKGFSAPH